MISNKCFKLAKISREEQRELNGLVDDLVELGMEDRKAALKVVGEKLAEAQSDRTDIVEFIRKNMSDKPIAPAKKVDFATALNETVDEVKAVSPIGEFARIFFRKVGTPTQYGALFDALKKYDVKISVVSNIKAAPDSIAVYSNRTNRIFINKSVLDKRERTPIDFDRTLAHEAIHALINNVIKSQSGSYETLHKDLVEFHDTLKPHLATAPDHVKKIFAAIEAGTAKVDELATYGLTNKTFANWLNSIKAGGVAIESQTLWGELKDIIVKVIDAVTGKTKLHKLNEILDAVIEEIELATALAPVKITRQEKRRLYNLHLKGKPTAKDIGETQTILLTGGPPGAGKTTGVLDTSVNVDVVIDPNADQIKVDLGHDQGEEAIAYHKEAKRISSTILNKAIRKGHHVAYDSLLGNYSKAKNLIERVLKRDGIAKITFTDIDAETSQVRVRLRKMAQEEDARAEGREIVGRKVPLSASVKSYNYSLPTFRQLFKEYKDNPNVKFTLYDNNVDGRDAITVFTHVDKKTEVSDNNLFDKFTNLKYIKTEDKGAIRYERKPKKTEQEIKEKLPKIRGRVYAIKPGPESDLGRGPEQEAGQPELPGQTGKSLAEEDQKPVSPGIRKVGGKSASKTTSDDLRADIDKKASTLAIDKLREAGGYLADAGKEFNEILNLLGEKGEFSTEFNPDKWVQIRPHLQRAWENVIAAGKSSMDFVDIAFEALGLKGRVYLEKFAEELDQNKKEATSGTVTTGIEEPETGGIGDREPGELPGVGKPSQMAPGKPPDVHKGSIPGRQGDTQEDIAQDSAKGVDIEVDTAPAGETPARPDRGSGVREDSGTGERTGEQATPTGEAAGPARTSDLRGDDSLTKKEDQNHVIEAGDLMFPRGDVTKIKTNIELNKI